MKKKLNILLLLLFVMLTCVNADQGKKSKEKEDLSKLLRRTAKMICSLNINESATPSFSKLKKRIVRHLKRAALTSGSKDQKKYFEDVIKTFKDNKYSDLKDFYFPNEAKSVLLLKYIEKSKTISAVVLKFSVEENLLTGKLFDKVRTEIKKGILERNVRFFPENNLVRIFEVIYPEDFKRESLVFDSPSKKDLHPRVVLISNVMKRYFIERIKPLSERIFRKKISAELNTGSLIRNIFLHHTAHFAIPFQTEVKEEKSVFKGSDLKNLFFPAEEIRADLNYLMIIIRMAEKKLLDDGVKEEVIYTFLLQKIDALKKMNGNKGSPSMILFNALYERGGIKSEKGGKVVVDLELLIRNIKNLESRFNDILKKGLHGDCKTFFQKHMEISDNIKNILEKKKSENIE